MIVKILAPSATFKAVRYNTDKVDKDNGELMKVANFGALQGLGQLKPSDYVNYLEARSATSSRIRYPQFHAVISCKGKSHTKQELTAIAELWLKGMGYGTQPYLLVFHKDTLNNHIHLVSTRIDESGRKIKDSYEKIRAYQVLNQVMGIDEKQQAVTDIEKAMEYNFNTRAQFMMLLEAKGYTLKLTDGYYLVCRYGKQQGSIELALVDAQIGAYRKDRDRLAQLRAITEKYRGSHDPALVRATVPLAGGKATKPQGYTSELAEFLASKFGMQVLFHGKDDKPAYAYTLVDHAKKIVFKGGDLMPLAEFTKNLENVIPISEHYARTDASLADEQINDTSQEVATEYAPAFETNSFSSEQILASTWLSEINLEISDDIDDEAILGRNRQRKRKARTNTR
ncbi:relaxase/mobilization nuclease domain-containing protein [Pedobacter sp. Hv1]|uniref:relaxase/mobilization nuclease domain-containing protein n=1 Tax=Pedobacter sp. Hv1 TaxID=1740090 RepID=UPI0006D8CF14|nr:relaxase/mobilization nuclease domain-containing protein [Pedobacter sp. Hv1]KQB99872.1 hypothetical protein AQF98_15270 [Pedobacter sp. Hv1]